MGWRACLTKVVRLDMKGEWGWLREDAEIQVFIAGCMIMCFGVLSRLFCTWTTAAPLIWTIVHRSERARFLADAQRGSRQACQDVRKPSLSRFLRYLEKEDERGYIGRREGSGHWVYPKL